MTIPESTPNRLPWNPADPFPFYERSRQHGDLMWDDDAEAWLVLGYHSAQQVLTGAGWTSDPNANPTAFEALGAVDSQMFHRNMLTADGENHLRLRNSARDVFTPAFIAQLQEGIDDVVTAAVNRMESGRVFDFVSEIAGPLPLAVIAAWLDLGVESARLLYEESPALSRLLSDFTNPDAVDAGAAAFAAVLTDLLPLAAYRRRHPGDDLLSFIAADPALELDEVVVTAFLIAAAGHETTTNLLGSAMIRLLTPDASGARLTDRVESFDTRVINEFLRLDGPAQIVARTATRDHNISGVAIAANQPVLVVLAAANRDPKVFGRHPDVFDPERRGPAPLTFGHGPHYCLGAGLARLELVRVLTAVLERRPALTGIPAWRDTPAIRGPIEVPMLFTKGPYASPRTGL